MNICTPIGSCSTAMCYGSTDEQNEPDQGRQQPEHPAGNPAMGAHHPDLTLHLESLANDRREIVEHLRQVAAGFALGQHGGDEEPRIEQRHPVREFLQRLGQRHAEVLPIEQQPELAPTGSWISSPTIWSAVVSAWPARSDRAIRSMASGNCSSNCATRFVRRLAGRR